jgi:hypothetical protein
LLHGKVQAEIRDQNTAGVNCHFLRTGAVPGSPQIGALQDSSTTRLEKPFVIQAVVTVDDVVTLAEETPIALACTSATTDTDTGDPDIAYAVRPVLVATPTESAEVHIEE